MRLLAFNTKVRTDRLADLMGELEGTAEGLTGAEALDAIGRTARLDAVLRARYSALAAAPPPTAAADSPRYLDAAQAASHLGVSRSTVLRLEKAGTLPCCRPSEGIVRFDRAELDRFMAERRAS